jgi:outer membrane protein OmpU
MKKILLATTMLAATAGFAAAEVTLSGDARMGITKSEGADAVFSNRARVKFSMSGETDGGLSFGASFRAADAVGAGSGTKGTVSLSGAFGSLSMGDESAAAEYAVGDLAMNSFAGVGDSNETTFLTGAKVVYTYTAGDLSVFVSTGQTGSDQNSLGVKYTTGGLTLGAGWETTGTVDHVAASAAYAMGDTTIKAVYGSASDVDFTQSGVSVSHTMGAVSLAAFYRTTDSAGVKADYSGVGVSYDLGGGASINGGVADVNGSNQMDLGVNFSF